MSCSRGKKQTERGGKSEGRDGIGWKNERGGGDIIMERRSRRRNGREGGGKKEDIKI